MDVSKSDKNRQEMCGGANLTDWLRDKNGNIIFTSVAVKLFHLIAIKFSSLDCCQAGIEMEAGKPGWCDALNGLPALFGSGFGETVELTSMTTLATELFSGYKNNIYLLKEQKDFYDSLLAVCKRDDLSRFELWDKMTAARENFRLITADGCDGEKVAVSPDYVTNALNCFYKILSASVKKYGKGIPPTYFYYKATDYRITGEEKDGITPVEIKGFTPVAMPVFLEGAARSCKLPEELRISDLPDRLRKSNLYDKTLGVYKTSESLERESIEIGRISNFSPGWLERESDFLHMDYKYLYGLLKGGYYSDFYKEIETNFVCFMSPEKYKRNPLENVSFIATDVNRDKQICGQGFYARLTGATTELISMVWLMFLGERPFVLLDGKLAMHVCPKLSNKFLKDGRATIVLFGDVEVTIVNMTDKECYDCKPYLYDADGRLTHGEYLSECESLAVREKRVKSLKVYIA